MKISVLSCLVVLIILSASEAFNHEAFGSEASSGFDGRFSTVREELCELRHDSQTGLSDVRYCIEERLDFDAGGKSLIEPFTENFRWLKLDFINSATPGDAVGPLGINLLFRLANVDFHNQSNGRMTKRQLADTVIVKLLAKDIFWAVTEDCKLVNKHGDNYRKGKHPLADSVVARSEEAFHFHRILSRPLFDGFISIHNLKPSIYLNEVIVLFQSLFPTEHFVTDCCEHLHLSSISDGSTNQFSDTSNLLLLLGKKLQLFNMHLPAEVKHASLLISHDESSRFLLSKCQIGSMKPDTKSEHMLDVGNSDFWKPNYCDKRNQAPLEMIDLQRLLIGKGAHRLLKSKMKLKATETYFDQMNPPCKIVIVERLQSDVFVDPFELQRLVQRKEFDAAYVYGDANLELPSFQSEQVIVEVHVPIADPDLLSVKDSVVQVNVSLPLHSRYPALNSEGYMYAKINIPHVFLYCGLGRDIGNTRFGERLNSKVNYTATPIIWAATASSRPEILQWRIPSGIPFHSNFVFKFTIFSAFMSVMIIFAASAHSLPSH